MYQAAENRYDHMKYRRSGRSGVLLPEISLGLWQNFGLEKPLEEQRDDPSFGPLILDYSFDLANNYGAPAEERRRKFWSRSGIRSGFLQRPAVYFRPRPVMTAGPVLTVTGAPANT